MNDADADQAKAKHRPRSASAIDMHVGRRVRTRRMLLGMSQEELGERLGLTFQQIQKYEKGINRISASRLLQLSNVLGVAIQFFFDDLDMDAAEEGDPEGAAARARDGMLQTQEGAELFRALDRIKDEHVRRAVVAHVHALASCFNKDGFNKDGMSVRD